LLQCGEQLVLLNHSICAQQLFYQLALYRFGGGCGLATLGQDETTMGAKSKGGIDIVTVVSQFVQMEELLQATNDTDRHDLVAQPDLVAINETNQALAEQAGDCLLQHADMLLEYYSIRIEKNNHTNGRILLTGLPVLLEGYEPSPHGLPLFLLRLATEVEWTQEKPCFEGICRELGYYYARLPSLSDDELDAFSAKIRHILFPSISALLIPPKALKKGNFVSLTSLPKLYRVFERC
jgi:DNA mismatch repair protein MLH1